MPSKRRAKIWKRKVLRSALTIFSLPIFSASAAGLFNDGADARTVAVGGIESAQSGSALAAMNSNPAALASISNFQFEGSFGATYLDASFHRDSGERAHTDDLAGLLPAAAFALPAPKNLPIHFGLAFLPDVTTEVSWRYQDAPGGLGGTTSYGEQTHRARILALRSAAAVGADVSPWFSIGASAGAIYTQNQLHAPYVFQSQPVLRGFKTLLDLDVDGFGAGFNLGAQLRPTRTFTLGLSYRFASTLYSEGEANGNASAQLQALGGVFATIDPTFHYHAEVRTKLPQIVSSAFEWQSLPQLRVLGGVDWINWSDAFDRLVIDLRDGSNAAINSVPGSPNMTDIAPLRWRDQFVFRGGLEFAATKNFTLRAGYSYARSAVPSETLTPLTAAIFDHKISAGAGYRRGRYHTDLAWIYALPARQHIGQSDLLTGEYSDSSIRVAQHSLDWSAGIDF